ncbi:hypothetical protein [Sunxiuqinia sp. sy24]|uniref:hypothetical protein n=1 Tax=Sunxiuqinia sp. sy24 TaxID=3461495 RepID=UPI0040462BD6
MIEGCFLKGIRSLKKAGDGGTPVPKPLPNERRMIVRPKFLRSHQKLRPEKQASALLNGQPESML